MADIRSDPEALHIASNEKIQSFLLSVSRNIEFPPDLRHAASKLYSDSSQTAVPYRCIKKLWLAASPSSRPHILDLFSGSDLIFRSPEPREKCEELKARLDRLKDLAERKAYEDMIRDITPKKDVNEPFSSYKDQLGFGMHVALTMFTGYLFGYAAFRALFGNSAVTNAAGGLVGLVCGMLLETILFIIKMSSVDFKASPSNTKKNQ